MGLKPTISIFFGVTVWMFFSEHPPTMENGQGDSEVHHEDISAWPTCSHTVTLSTRRRLTTGLSDGPSRPNSKTFCIGVRRRP